MQKLSNDVACTNKQVKTLIAQYGANQKKIKQLEEQIQGLEVKLGAADGASNRAKISDQVKKLREEILKINNLNRGIQKQIVKVNVATESVNVDEMTQEDLDLMMESIFSDIAKKAEQLKPKPSTQQAQAKLAANEAELKRLKLMLNDITCMKRRKDIDPATIRMIGYEGAEYDRYDDDGVSAL